jgi:hypothetical protein
MTARLEPNSTALMTSSRVAPLVERVKRSRRR